jgi:regulator of cell morphogenesis and NO signaling
MTTITADTHVADLVLEQPGRARVFERYGIDYCCGGRTPLTDACAELGLEADDVIAALEASPPAPTEVDWTTRALGELTAHIVETHHGYLREELPLLRALVDKVARAHGDRHPELADVHATFTAVADELEQHLATEERDVFPACVALETGGSDDVAEPIGRMVHEHEAVAVGLARLRELTNAYEPPSDACNSYRSMLDRLRTLETDTHQHVHKENNILFPRAEALAETR